MSYTPTAKGYFTGGAGMELGFMQAGVDVIQSLDVDPEATDVMKMNPHYFSHPILTQDIRTTTVIGQPKSDIIIGTYPCTKYSTIADIHGTRTGDDLYLHFFRTVVLDQPEMYVLENVPGMKKFKVVMEAMTRLPGYYVNVFCPVDALNWLPQKRQRLILFGTRKPFYIFHPQQSAHRQRLRDILEKDPVYKMPECILSRIKGNYRDKPIIVDPDAPGAFAPTCVAHYAKDQGTRLVKDKNSEHGLRPFTIREYARLQGYPDDFIFPNKLSSYKIIGNAVPTHMGNWAGQQAMRYFN